ncbi:type III-B CRISPR module-associated protein Cmr5 [Clostridium cochlearium]|uniref:type III-B CRISPR module-associated protein Cmr5 n=1 Tax=Clostridium cochlearium TaxID=1494 RepID=UPI001FA8AA8F|nr:type III-B CRISPR module-associated protein Cmr5 [Clostridium cochlearium]
MEKNKDLKRLKANFAFNKIIQIKEESEDKKNDLGENFKSHIKNIPIYIYNNGLIYTLSFIVYKSNKHDKSYTYIKNILLEYLKKSFVYGYENFRNKEFDDTIKFLTECSSKDYRKITIEILSILEWLIRFSDGMLEGEENGEK